MTSPTETRLCARDTVALREVPSSGLRYEPPILKVEWIAILTSTEQGCTKCDPLPSSAGNRCSHSVMWAWGVRLSKACTVCIGTVDSTLLLQCLFLGSIYALEVNVFSGQTQIFPHKGE